jgi:hypothetical protein
MIRLFSVVPRRVRSVPRPHRAIAVAALVVASSFCFPTASSAEPTLAVDGHVAAFAYHQAGSRPDSRRDLSAGPAFGATVEGAYRFELQDLYLAPEIGVRVEGRPHLEFDDFYTPHAAYSVFDLLFLGGLRVGVRGTVSPSFFVRSGGGLLTLVGGGPIMPAIPLDAGLSVDVRASEVVSVGLTAAYEGVLNLGTAANDGIGLPASMHGFALGPRLSFAFPMPQRKPPAPDPELPPP